MADAYPYGIIGTVLGGIAVIICIVQAVIMAKLWKRLSAFIQEDSRTLLKNADHRNKQTEKDVDRYHETNEDWSQPPTKTNMPPAMRMLPLNQSNDHKLSYPSLGSNSLESYLSDSSNEQEHECVVDKPSPTVAELKNSLALPLKNILTKSYTLDSRQNAFHKGKVESLTDTSVRPRAQTSSAVTSPDKPTTVARTPPTDNDSTSGFDSALGTPGSDDLPCTLKNPLAYVVTEIVDVKDTKKRPSVRLRESRPKKQLSRKIQRQIEQPDPFYFTLDASGAPNMSHVNDANEPQEKAGVSPSPTKIYDSTRHWRQVLPTAGQGNQASKMPPEHPDENENKLVQKNMPKEDWKITSMSPSPEPKYRRPLKPPTTSRKPRTPVTAASTSALQRGGTWSPRTLERHRMLVGEVERKSNKGPNGLTSRNRAGSLRDHFPRPPSPTPYEPVITRSATSTFLITCAEDKGDYSRLVWQQIGRPRASSIDSSYFLGGPHSDRPYNKLVL